MLNLSISTLLSVSLKTFIVLLLAYGGACWFLFQRQRQMIFFPSPTVESTPATHHLPFEEIWIPVVSDSTIGATASPDAAQQAADDQFHGRIHGWWIPASQDATPVLLYLHGNGANISANISKASWFYQFGFSIMLVDYRGYGLSEGAFPSEAQVYEDAESTWHYLIHTLGVSPDRLFVFGHSLGGAIAIELATRHPDLAGLIIEGAFTSMLDMSDRTKNFSIFPVNRILTQRFNSIDKVRSLTTPVLYVHGTDDEVVPADMSQTLYRATLSAHDLLMVPGAGHENVVEIGGYIYGQTLQRFIEQSGYAAAPA